MRSYSKKDEVPGDENPASTQPIAPVLTIANGDRVEIALEYPQEKAAFFDFVRSVLGNFDTDIQVRTQSFLNSASASSLKSFARYFYEGWLKENEKRRSSYQASGLDLITLQELLKLNNLKGLKGIDFGFGNGEVQKVLSEAGAKVIGLDLSPFFVQNARSRGFEAFVAEIDQENDQFKYEFKKSGSQDFALATLVLDRLKYPHRFLLNFFSVLKSGGSFAIQTLLPIVPKDDGPVKRPIIYTDPQNKLTPGLKIEEDRDELKKILEKISMSSVNISQISYQVKSLDGVQNYSLWSFNGKKNG